MATSQSARYLSKVKRWMEIMFPKRRRRRRRNERKPTLEGAFIVEWMQAFVLFIHLNKTWEVVSPRLTLKS